MRGANRCQKSFIYFNNCYLHIVCNVASTPLAVLTPWWDNPPIRSTIWGLFKGDLDWQTEHGQSFCRVCNRESTQAWKIWIRDVLRHCQCIYRVMHQQARVVTETLVGLKKVSELPWLRLRLYIDISCHPHCIIPKLYSDISTLLEWDALCNNSSATQILFPAKPFSLFGKAPALVTISLCQDSMLCFTCYYTLVAFPSQLHDWTHNPDQP